MLGKPYRTRCGSALVSRLTTRALPHPVLSIVGCERAANLSLSSVVRYNLTKVLGGQTHERCYDIIRPTLVFELSEHPDPCRCSKAIGKQALFF